MTWIFDLFDPIAHLVVLCGMVIMLWGIVLCLIQFFRSEISKKEIGSIDERKKIRIQLGTYLLLGLEFLIAADIIHSAHNPQLESLYVLGLIVLIRTVISFFLNRELEQNSIKKLSTHGEKG